MKNLKLNTDNRRRFKLKDEPFENILIYGGNTDYLSNLNHFFGYFCEDGINIWLMEEKHWTRFNWLIDQIEKYKANVYIIFNKYAIGNYRYMLDWLYNHNIDVSNVKLLKEGEKADILEQFGEL